MAAKKKQRKRAEFPQYEWDFSTCPNELIWDCWIFEYSREHIKQGCSLPHWMEDLFKKNMQFPKTPFLQLHKIGRAPLITETDLMSTTEDVETPKNELALLVNYLSVWGDYNSIHATKKRANWETVWKINIDWTHSDAILTKEFLRFIQEIRPGRKAAAEKRGHNPRRARLAELKKLGAFRLLESGYTATQATEVTERISGRPLFLHGAAWSAAKKEAKRILLEWPPEYLDPTS